MISFLVLWIELHLILMQPISKYPHETRGLTGFEHLWTGHHWLACLVMERKVSCLPKTESIWNGTSDFLIKIFDWEVPCSLITHCLLSFKLLCELLRTISQNVASIPLHSCTGLTNKCCCATANRKPVITSDVTEPNLTLGNDNEWQLSHRKMGNRNCNYSKTKRNIQKITLRSCFPW